MGGLKQTGIYIMLQNARKVNEAEAWFDAFNRDKVLQDQILERIKDQLYNQNVDEDGQIIGRYSFYTSIINPDKVYNSPYTLNDTGEFYASLFIEWFPSFIIINGDGEKGEENLFEMYGNGIIGLTAKNREWLSQELKKRYIGYVKRVLYRY